MNRGLDDCTYFKIVKYLVSEDPTAVEFMNHYGLLPVSYASSRSVEATKFLVDLYPDCLQMRDFVGGRMLIHSACRNGSLEIVKFLYDLDPECIFQLTMLDDLPLHEAVEAGSLPVIRYLTEKRPDSVKRRGQHGDLPLHRLCKHFRPELIAIKEVFDLFPAAIHTTNSQGCLPLHCIFSPPEAPKKEVFQFLFAQLPYGIKVRDKSGRVPAHFACGARDLSLKDLKHIIGLYPDAVRVESPVHGLPIHVACSEGRNLQIVKYLESLYPESLDIGNNSVGLPLECAEGEELFEYLLLKRYNSYFQKRGSFPLHAIFQDDGLKSKKPVAKRLIEYFPPHARDIDKRGSNPLHQAVAAVSDVDLIRELLTLNPEAVEKRDVQGSLPLHYALRNQPSKDIAECLVEAFPAGLGVADHQGSTPLHIACRYAASVDVVSYLQDTYPEGIRAVDRHGCTPLHAACRHGSSLEVVQHLVETDQNNLHILDEHQELPIHKACRGGHVSLLRYLLERNMPAASARNASGMLPVFILCQSSGKSREVLETPEYVEAIWQLLLAHPESVMSGLV